MREMTRDRERRRSERQEKRFIRKKEEEKQRLIEEERGRREEQERRAVEAEERQKRVKERELQQQRKQEKREALKARREQEQEQREERERERLRKEEEALARGPPPPVDLPTLTHAVKTNDLITAAYIVEEDIDNTLVNRASGKAKYTALSWAVLFGHMEMTEMLLQAGADSEAKDCYGMRPIHHAVNSNNPEVVRMLCEHGCDVSAEDLTFSTPLIMTQERDRMVLHGTQCRQMARWLNLAAEQQLYRTVKK